MKRIILFLIPLILFPVFLCTENPVETEPQDTMSTINADTAAPDIPQSLAVDSIDTLASVVHLSWSANDDNDLDGYRIYRSGASDTSWLLISNTINETHLADTVDSAGGMRYYYAVTALDTGGNESEKAAIETPVTVYNPIILAPIITAGGDSIQFLDTIASMSGSVLSSRRDVIRHYWGLLEHPLLDSLGVTTLPAWADSADSAFTFTFPTPAVPCTLSAVYRVRNSLDQTSVDTIHVFTTVDSSVFFSAWQRDSLTLFSYLDYHGFLDSFPVSVSSITERDPYSGYIVSVNLSALEISDFTPFADDTNRNSGLAALSYLNKLSLLSNPLNTLSGDISVLTNLTWLSLSGDSLSGLPAEFSNLSGLKHLNLSNNRIETLPSVLFGLHGLVYLNLSLNQLSAIDPDIGTLTELDTLIINNNRIETLPETIAQLTQLVFFDFSNNQIASLPDGLARINLDDSCNPSYNRLYIQDLSEEIVEWLNYYDDRWKTTQYFRTRDSMAVLAILDANDIDDVPVDSVVLVVDGRIKKLDLSGFSITTLPPDLDELKELDTLIMIPNLTQIPEAVWDLRRLKTLKLSSEYLTDIPDEISELDSLETLWLTNSPLTELPGGIGSLFNLTELNISGNELEESDSLFTETDTPDLEKLNISGNRYSRIPSWIYGMTNLKTLYADSNRIDSIPGTIGELTKVNFLGLGDNQISALPDAITELAPYQFFSIGGNKLCYDSTNTIMDWLDEYDPDWDETQDCEDTND